MQFSVGWSTCHETDTRQELSAGCSESCLFRYTSHKKPPFDDIAKTPRVP
eukprot:COSAG04_NODE_90_length_26856_cov_18.273723_16_plen_50_part_00